MSTRIFGIKNCDTVKKSLVYLEKHHIAYEFHDYKKLGIEASKIKEWLKSVKLEHLINTKGPTYRNLSDEEKLKLTKVSTAIPVMQANTSIIKRPLIEHMGEIILGFNAEEYSRCFKL
jgi:arsenate reductase